MYAPLGIAVVSTALLTINVGLLMRPKRFYFVRHGETLLNAQHIRQGADGGLSEHGRQQAARAARALARVPIKHIITSTYPRAQETAHIINERLHVPITSSPLLVERRNPSAIIGKRTDDPEAERIIDRIELAYHSDDYRYADEENFADLKKRAKKCIAFLARRGACETCVITHHIFLKMLISYLLYRERLHAADFTKLAFFNFMDNVGITVCEFHPWRILNATHGWEVIAYNERP